MSLWCVFMDVNITFSEKKNHLIVILTELYHTQLAKAPFQSALFFSLLFSAVYDVTKASGALNRLEFSWFFFCLPGMAKPP